jgi:hypothetical protein
MILGDWNLKSTYYQRLTINIPTNRISQSDNPKDKK